METLSMSMSKTERRRLEVFGRVRGGEVTLVKASELLGLSYYRQAKRSCASPPLHSPHPCKGGVSIGENTGTFLSVDNIVCRRSLTILRDP